MKKRSGLWAASWAVSAVMILGEQFPVFAQSMMASPDNTGTVIFQDGQTYHIQGGKQAGENLFHSFQAFGLSPGEIANFFSNPSIINVLGRITGGEPSIIQGLIQITGANSNLYLMNPAGFVFGAEAQLNINGDFFATTADRIGFDGGEFNAFGLNDYGSLIGAPNQFLFLQANPSAIINLGVLTNRQDLHFLGGTVLNQGRIVSAAGSVTLAAIPGTRLVNLSQPGLLLSLDIPSGAIAPTQTLNPLTLPALLTGSVTNDAIIQGNTIDLYATHPLTVPNSDGIQGETRVIRWSDTGENPTQAVFIDGRVSNPETLLFGGAAGTVTQLVHAAENGVTAVGEGLGAIASSVGALESVAIVADGNVGNFWLGNQWVNSQTISHYQADLQAWGDALTDTGDLLLYSCLTALGAVGEAFLTQFATATGADVAASVDGTGSPNRNGNWDLEAQTGSIEATLPFTPERLRNWEGHLATLTVTDAADRAVNDGQFTLREAILAANTNGVIDGQVGTVGEDRIVFDTTGEFATPRTILLGSNLPTITDDLVITGPGENQLTIDGDGITNSIFEAFTDYFTVEQLTLQKSDGDGIYHDAVVGGLTLNDVTIADSRITGIFARFSSSASLTQLNRVTLMNNGFEGLNNRGSTLEINQSLITGNQSGGVFHSSSGGAAEVRITDSTIANNYSFSSGAAISVRGRDRITVTIAGSQILNNTAGSGGGIEVNNLFSTTSLPVTLSITDTQIAGNEAEVGGGIYFAIGPNSQVNATLDRVQFQNNQATLPGGGGGGDLYFETSGQKVLAIADSVGDLHLDLGGNRAQLDLNSSGAIHLTGRFDPQGQDMTLNAQGGIDLTGLTLSPTAGGDLTFTARGDINTKNLFTTALTGDSGNLTLISRQGNITTTNGTFGSLDTRSHMGNSGQVTLRAAGDIVTGPINTEAQQGAGGTVNLRSGGDVRVEGVVTSTFLTEPASISTAGATQSGTLAIHHGGRGVVPFTVGDATVNGTSSAIAVGNQTLAAPQAFLQEHRQPGILITPGPMPSLSSPSTPPIAPSQPAPIGIGLTGLSEATGVIAGAQPVRSLSSEQFLQAIGEQAGGSTAIQRGQGTWQGNWPETMTVNSTTSNFTWNLPGENAFGGSLSNVEILQQVAQLDQFMGESFGLLSGNSPDAIDDVDNPDNGDREAGENESETDAIANIHEIFQRITEQTGTVPALVYAISQPDFLELIVITPDQQLRRVVVPDGDRASLRSAIAQFRRAITSKNDDYYAPAQQLYNWLIRPIENILTALDVDNLVFSMGEDLRALPLAALHDGEKFLIEKYSIGQIPSLSLTNSQYQPLHNARVLSMGASEFKTLDPLPAVPAELAIIQTKNPNVTYLNDQFNWDSLYQESNQRQFEIVHLATHAEFQRDFAQNAYIQLWDDERITINKLRKLDWYDAPQVELLVLSACLTALGDPEAELGFAGLAVQAGVKSVLASLWKISDVGTLQLMNGFYEQLNNPTITTKSEALRQAQLAMIRGDFDPLNRQEIRAMLTPEMQRDLQSSALSHPFYWSGFLLVGSPW